MTRSRDDDYYEEDYDEYGDAYAEDDGQQYEETYAEEDGQQYEEDGAYEEDPAQPESKNKREIEDGTDKKVPQRKCIGCQEMKNKRI